MKANAAPPLQASPQAGMAGDNKDGTQASGFVTAQDNPPPRQCDNCRKYEEGACTDPTVSADQEVGEKYGIQQNDQGQWMVPGDACCDYFQSGSAGSQEPMDGGKQAGSAAAGMPSGAEPSGYEGS